MTKEEKQPHIVQNAQNDNSLALTSMLLGVVSLTGFGFLLGIPAIILAAIALKKKAGDRGLSITGLVTGIISTVASLIFLVSMLFLIVWGFTSLEETPQHPHPEAEKIFPRAQT